ncbi:MAG: cyclic nucleotide-binding domain-containing protein [Spirochaetales bacterium]|nr:cyclic nucleotide-binding domain-containing protein [Spirochaetales bacterium]
MQKAVAYKSNSIVFFKGDMNDKVYILKSGTVNLRFNDIETGQEIHDVIKTGEFFGVKSALGHYPREETAVVMNDATMLVFTVPEFEQVILKNTRIIMKMLKVFSNQLRRIHKQVQNLLSKGEQGGGPEAGLFRIGEYYMHARRYRQALYAFSRYLTYYPSGKYASEATKNIEMLESQPSHGYSPDQETPEASRVGNELSEMAKQYYNGVSLFSQQKHEAALKEFKHIIMTGEDAEYTAKSLYEIGRCYYSLSQYDQCIQHYSGMIQKYPHHSELVDALYYVGSCYEKKGDIQKAKGFYTKILSMISDDKPVARKAKKSLKNLEGK